MGENIFGPLSPWSWAIEPVRGCNLRCGHCATRLFTDKPKFMTEEAWRTMWKVIATVTPCRRTEMANAGEPTLHPDLVNFVKIAREISPQTQIQITTNGTMLATGKLTYKKLFNAGVNIIYVDMYAPKETHLRLAKESGIPFYEYLKKPDNMPGAWSYTGPDLKLIVLMEHPGNWPQSRRSKNRLGTFYNHMDWEAAKPFGLVPVTQPVQKNCSQPFHYVSVHNTGEYELCCQDFMGETAGTIGSVFDGPQGFVKFWFGKFMQDVRRHLSDHDRASLPHCSRCSITFSRADLMVWEDDCMDRWWDGKKWHKFPEKQPRVGHSEAVVQASLGLVKKIRKRTKGFLDKHGWM